MADGVDPPHHPLNPVARDQVFFTCKDCQHSRNWRRSVGECGHPEHTLHLVEVGLISRVLGGKLQLGQSGMGYGTDVPFAIRIENDSGHGHGRLHCPTVTDLQVCSSYKAKE